jgi:hypothetical protein
VLLLLNSLLRLAPRIRVPLIDRLALRRVLVTLTDHAHQHVQKEDLQLIVQALRIVDVHLDDVLDEVAESDDTRRPVYAHTNCVERVQTIAQAVKLLILESLELGALKQRLDKLGVLHVQLTVLVLRLDILMEFLDLLQVEQFLETLLNTSHLELLVGEFGFVVVDHVRNDTLLCLFFDLLAIGC